MHSIIIRTNKIGDGKNYLIAFHKKMKEVKLKKLILCPWKVSFLQTDAIQWLLAWEILIYKMIESRRTQFLEQN